MRVYPLHSSALSGGGQVSQLAVQVLFTPQIRSAQSTPAIGRTEDNRVQASGKTRAHTHIYIYHR